MTLRYLLDSNLRIRILRDRPPHLQQRFNREAEGLSISTITYRLLSILTELLHGAVRSARPQHNRTEVERIAARLEVLPLDADAADHAADIRAEG